MYIYLCGLRGEAGVVGEEDTNGTMRLFMRSSKRDLISERCGDI